MSKSLYLRKRFFSSLNTASRIRCLDDIPWYNETLAFEFRPNCSTMSVYNPADPTFIVGNVPIRTQQDTKEAIERSYQAWTSDLSSWRDFVTPARRASLLTRWSKLIEERAQDIASLMTLESGKTLTESIAEIHYAKSFLDYYAAEAIRLGGKVLPVAFSEASRPRGQGMTLEQPIGVTALITPWNFPLAMITRKVAPALAAGCTVLIKPSERTPLSAIVIGQLAQEVGIPSDVIQVLTTDFENTPAVSKELCTNPLVRKISFTGSTNVGKQLMALSSSTIKRLSLELGGNAPFLVFDDALLDQAVTAAISSKFRNAGQTCVCADRFLVQRNIYEEFLERLAQAMDESIVVGNGLDPKTTMGPLISAQSRDRVHAKVKAAVLEGAGIVRGGGCLESLPGYFYAPTLLRDVSVESDIWKTETFGPVAAVLPFDTEEEGIAIANDSNLGLASYVMTRDLARTFRVSKALEAGMVGVNDGILSTCTAPFGGIKESGLGREGGTAGLHEYLETKYVFINY